MTNERKATPIRELNNRQLLIALNRDMSWVKKILGNHLKHHQAYEVALVIGILLLIADRIINSVTF